MESPRAVLIAQALEAHAPALRRFVGARVPAADVEDVLQSAAMRAVERCETLKDPERVLPWLYRLHRNVIADALRKRASGERLLAAQASELAPSGGESAADATCNCGVVQAQRLRPAYAEVLALVDAGEATLPEAAKVLGVSTNNATVRLHRARKALREAMLHHCGVQSARDCMDCRCVLDGCCAD